MMKRPPARPSGGNASLPPRVLAAPCHPPSATQLAFPPPPSLLSVCAADRRHFPHAPTLSHDAAAKEYSRVCASAPTTNYQLPQPSCNDRTHPSPRCICNGAWKRQATPICRYYFLILFYKPKRVPVPFFFGGGLGESGRVDVGVPNRDSPCGGSWCARRTAPHRSPIPPPCSPLCYRLFPSHRLLLDDASLCVFSTSAPGGTSATVEPLRLTYPPPPHVVF